MTKIIDRDLNGRGSLRAHLIEGSTDLLAVNFYTHIYPEIDHFEFGGHLLSTIIETILESEQESLLFIENLEIEEEFQGKGEGTRILHKLLEEASSDFVMLIASPIGDSKQSLQDLTSFYSKFGLSKILELPKGVGFLMSTH